MKAMLLTGLKRMKMCEVPTPAVTSDTDVLIRMVAVGICGSDVHYHLTGRIGSQVVSYPFTVGHECSGIVEAVGPAVQRVKPGDRVAIEPAMPCFECDQCRSRRHHTCRSLRFLGCPGQAEGCLSEYIVMPEQSCFAIRDSMSMTQAALSEPLAIGLYSVKRSVAMIGAKIAILGTGPIGLSVLLTAAAEGAEKIYVTDKIDARLRLAKKAGAAWTGNPDKKNIVKAITKLEPLGLDAVFECCGQQDALDEAVEILKPGGKLMIVGIPQEERVSFIIDKIRRKEICLQNVRRQVDCVQEALDLIDTCRINVDQMVTHRFTFEKTKDAFKLLAGYKDGVMKAMIDF